MPRIIHQPDTHHHFQRGVNSVVEAIRPTLGPRPRAVAVASRIAGQMPELLDNGGLIARRIIELPQREENMGAMFVRSLLWQLYERTGDGTATTALLFQHVYDQGVHYVAGGGNAMLLRRHLENGLQIILDQLSAMTMPVDGRAQIAQVADTLCGDAELSAMLGEIFDIIGAFGRLEIRAGTRRELEREYVEGMYWSGGVFSRHLLTAAASLKMQVDNAAILISDLSIDEPDALVPLLETVLQTGLHSLVIIARHISDRALSLILANQDASRLQILAVKVPGENEAEQATALDDLAVLTAGCMQLRAAGASLSNVRVQDLGFARHVWADRSQFGVVGGKGDPRVLRTHIAGLRSAFQTTVDNTHRRSLRTRLGKLLGGTATLYIGAGAVLAVEARQRLAERTAESMRGALSDGLLPGGGVALLHCREALQMCFDKSESVDERAAYRILLQMLSVPIRALVSNAGYDPAHVLSRLHSPDMGCDLRSGQIVDMVEAGIFDVAAVQKAAVQMAVSQAALALTIDVLIHPLHPTPTFGAP